MYGTLANYRKPTQKNEVRIILGKTKTICERKIENFWELLKISSKNKPGKQENFQKQKK